MPNRRALFPKSVGRGAARIIEPPANVVGLKARVS